MFLGPFVVGSVIACRTIPTDGKDSGAMDTASTTVDNTAPTVAAVTLNPANIYTDSTITATASLSDDDGQTVTADYAWHVVDAATGADTEVQTGAGNSLDGTVHFNKDDQVYVVVTPNDGLTDGAAVASTSVTIANTDPVLSAATITTCLLYTSPSPRDQRGSRMPSSA